MGRRDEEIIAHKRGMIIEEAEKAKQEKLDREKAESIFDGMIHLDNREVIFERKEFPEYGLSILVPADFEEIEDRLKEQVYVYGKMPDYLLSGLNIPFQMSLTKTENTVPNYGIPKFMKIAQNAIERIGPKSKVLANYVKTNGKYNVGVMELSAMAMDGPIYACQIYISKADEKLIIGSMNCMADHYSRMLPVFQEMIDSIIFDEETA